MNYGCLLGSFVLGLYVSLTEKNVRKVEFLYKYDKTENHGTCDQDFSKRIFSSCIELISEKIVLIFMC